MKHHLILVPRGSTAAIVSAIRRYEQAGLKGPASYVVKVFTRGGGSHVVVFEQRLPAFDFNNLTYTLGLNSDGVMGWWASENGFLNVVCDPVSGELIHLVTSTGRCMTSYLPTNDVYPAIECELGYTEPPSNHGELASEFAIALEDLQHANNPTNAITAESADALDRKLTTETNQQFRRAMLWAIVILIGIISVIVFVGLGVASLFR